MRHAIDQLDVKGSILVIKNGHTYLRYATANQPDTSYLINSVQKSMTACLVMREIQDKKLSLDTKLKSFYPDVPGSDQVTVKNLLNMTSGLYLKNGQRLGNQDFVSDQDNIKSDVTKTKFNKSMLNKWQYSDVNYVYLCGILSKLENTSYEKIFTNTYIKPLNLQRTAFLWQSKEQLQKIHLALPSYRYSQGKYHKIKLKNAISDAHRELGAGSIAMSNDDLAKVIENIVSGNLLTNKSRKVLYDAGAPAYYNGGFYNYSEYRAANGAGQGYSTYLRVSNNGKDLLLIQTNKTDHNKFVKNKPNVNFIMNILMNW